MVAAPTGAGKTVVAEHAIAVSLRRGTKAFYTTPIKALSNQKYHDLVALHGSDNVGLLTGDTSINGQAPIVVMTTEVLRNMLYARARTLNGLEHVVLDEVHYLQDRHRGPVWEEVIVHSPPEVKFVCLSATVSNADELAAWIEAVRGPTELVAHGQRPVELTNLYMASERRGSNQHVIPVLVDGAANPEGHRFTQEPAKRGHNKASKQRRDKPFATPSRLDVLDALEERELLPAIVFVFSRARCDEASQAMADGGVALTQPGERDEIERIANRHALHLGASDRTVLRYDRFLKGLKAGVAAHHAGMVPAFKEAVEECFVQGLVKLVYATETLALGINMPARAVVIEQLTKFNGDTHEFLTPLEYTQLTGRAGRRGIDDAGFALVLWSRFVTFDQVAGLASSRSFALRSAFRPTYNMSVNLVKLHDRDGAHALLDRSFGQFQADRDLSQMDRRRQHLQAEIRGARDRLVARGADPDAEVPHEAQPQASADGIEAALSRLRLGDIIAAPGPGGAEPAVVTSVAYRKGGAIKVRLVSRSREANTFGIDDFQQAPQVLGAIEMPEPYLPNSGSFRHELVRRLQRSRLRRPKSSEPDTPRQARGAGPENADRNRLTQAQRRLAKLEQRISGRASRLARQFDDMVGILQHHGYIANWEPTSDGEMLRAIFHESDLAIAECIKHGAFDSLSPAEMAAVASCFTYEHRGPGESTPPRIRSAGLRATFANVEAIVADLRLTEAEAGTRLTRETDMGFVTAAAGWAGGDALSDVLDADEVTGGDFVRQVRQLIDLLRQIAKVAPQAETRRVAAQAAEGLNRGVVVASTALDEQTDDAVAR